MREISIDCVKNVFNPEKGQRYRISASPCATDGEIIIVIYNRNAKKIKEIFRKNVRAETAAEVMWYGRNEAGKAVSSGIYMVVVKTPCYTTKEKVVIVK